MLTRFARQELAELDVSSNFTQRVRDMLAAQLRQGTSREAVAAGLDVSTRTLARRLESAGVDFSTLLDDLRSERSIHYLTSTTLGLKAIAEKLGYATSGSFVRAFIRWHGQAPNSSRRNASSTAQKLSWSQKPVLFSTRPR